MKDFSLLSTNPFSNARGPMYNPRGRVTAGGGSTPSGFVSNDTLDTSIMNLVGRWRAEDGLSVGANLVEAGSTPTTTPSGAAAKSFPDQPSPVVRWDAIRAIADQQIFFGLVANIPTAGSGQIMSAGQKIYTNADGGGTITCRIPSTATRTFNNDAEAFDQWQVFLFYWEGAQSYLRYADKTFVPNLNPGTSGFALDDIFLGVNEAMEIAEAIVCTHPSNFLGYAAQRYGVGGGINRIIGSSGITNPVGGEDYNPGTNTVGWQFSLSEDKNLIGFEAQVPTAAGRNGTKLALWRQSDSALLATEAVDLQNPDLSALDIAVSTDLYTPVTLSAGVEYVIGFYDDNLSSFNCRRNLSDYTLDSAITISNTGIYSSSRGNMPTSNSGNNYLGFWPRLQNV